MGSRSGRVRGPGRCRWCASIELVDEGDVLRRLERLACRELVRQTVLGYGLTQGVVERGLGGGWSH